MGAGEPTFGVLGPLRVEVGARAVPLPGSAVVRGLLGVLLLAGGRPLAPEQLIELVWADRADRTGRGPVQAAVSRLREWLGRLPGDPPPIVYDRGGYRLAVPPGAVDLGRFRALVRRADAAEDVAVRRDLLESALALRRGPALTDLGHDAPLLREVEDGVRHAAVAYAEASVTTGRAGPAVARLTALAGEYPLDEELHASLIELLAADGRPADALRHHQAVRERITGELGVEPGARVRRAYLTVLARDRDHGRPQGPFVEAAIPPPEQLPPDIADFTGRENQAERLVRALDGGVAPAVAVISGMGGAGKTALAVHVAHRLAPRFPDGRLYADLGAERAEPADPHRVLGGFLTALGIAAHAVPEAVEERTALLRSLLAGRRVLLLLDNAASERQVRPLLPGSPGSAVIVTSRTRLTGLESARPVELGVFDAHEATGLLARLAGSARVAAEPEAAADIARLCGYVPLAVRIAGARLAGRRHWRLAHLVTLLGDERRRLDELSAGDLAVRAGFAVSYTRLPGETRHLFRLLGLLEVTEFAGWTAAALLDVPVETARDHLEALVDAQLLQVADPGDGDPGRYRCHDLVHLYARERAHEEDPPDVRSAALVRTFGAWLALSERAAERVPGPCYAAIHGDAPRRSVPPVPGDPEAWFDTEWPAIVAAVRQACDLGLDEYAWDLACCLEKYFDVRAMTAEWRATHERALELCRATGNLRGEAVLVRGLLEVTTWSSADPAGPAMATLHERSRRLLEMFERAGEPRGMADALVNCAWGLVAEGRPDDAVAAAGRALELAREHGHPGGAARAHHLMGIAYGTRRIGSAIEHLTRALELARELGNPRFEATALQFLGAAHCAAGRTGSGHDLLIESLTMCHERGDRYAEAFSLLYLAKLYAGQDDPRARPTAEAVLSVSRRHGMRHHLADALRVLGDLDLAAGRHASAVLRLEESVRIWRSRGWSSFLAETLRSLGHAHAGAGDTEAAARAWTEARSLFGRLSDAVAEDEVDALLRRPCRPG